MFEPHPRRRYSLGVPLFLLAAGSGVGLVLTLPRGPGPREIENSPPATIAFQTTDQIVLTVALPTRPARHASQRRSVQMLDSGGAILATRARKTEQRTYAGRSAGRNPG